MSKICPSKFRAIAACNSSRGVRRSQLEHYCALIQDYLSRKQREHSPFACRIYCPTSSLIMCHRYPLSKLVDVLLVRQMAALLPVRETGVVINCANPGLCKTGLSKNAKFQVRIMIRAMNTVMGRTPETGSRPLLYAAVAPETSHGCYVNCCKVAE